MYKTKHHDPMISKTRMTKQQIQQYISDIKIIISSEESCADGLETYKILQKLSPISIEV
jgi:hypothetical protein